MADSQSHQMQYEHSSPGAREMPHFVAPRSYLQPRNLPRSQGQGSPSNPLEREQLEALVSSLQTAAHTELTNAKQRAIRAFLKIRTSYDVLPLSFRLIVFDTALLVKKSLNTLIQNGMCKRSLSGGPTSYASILRNCFSTIVGLADFHLRWPIDGL